MSQEVMNQYLPVHVQNKKNITQLKRVCFERLILGTFVYFVLNSYFLVAFKLIYPLHFIKTYSMAISTLSFVKS